MPTLKWVICSVVGFGLMIAVYGFAIRIAEPNPWTSGLMFVGQGEPADSVGQANPVTLSLIYLAPSAGRKQWEDALASSGITHRPLPQEKLILDPELDQHFSARLLASGRLPQPGTNEILAGWETETRENLTWGDQTLQVVGILNPSVMMFAHSYLLPDGGPASDFFRPPYEEPLKAYVVPATRETLRHETFQAELTKAFPADQFECLGADGRRVRVTGGAFVLFTVGTMLFVLGGVGLLWRLYTWLAGSVRISLLAEPLRTIVAWKRTWWAIHLACFGLYFLGTLLAFGVPELQTLVTEQVRRRFNEDPLLRMVLGAYSGKHILYAAGLTLANNFLRSFVFLTLGSFLLPGLGLLLVLLMGTVIGMALAPATNGLALAMLPHSVVLLLEMEGYILAGFFALLVPIYLVRKCEGPSLPRRYGRAVLLNLKANVLVLITLAVVACYEAIEVILQL